MLIQEIRKQLNIKSRLTQYLLIILLLSFTSFLKLAVYSNNDRFLTLFLHFVGINTLGLLLFYLEKFIIKNRFVNLNNILISLNIIYLIMHPYKLSEPNMVNFPTIIAVFCILALVRRIRWGNSPIFNPAAMTCFLYVLLIDPNGNNSFISWWGSDLNKLRGIEHLQSFANLASLILSLILIYYVYLFKKHFYSGIFFTLYLLYETYLRVADNLYINELVNTLVTVFNNSTSMFIFFTFVMLSEPRTTPIKILDQLVHGLLGFIIYLLIGMLASSTANYSDHLSFLNYTEILTILMLNTVYFLQRKLIWKS